jgi:hypothetical protein
MVRYRITFPAIKSFMIRWFIFSRPRIGFP